MCGISGIAGKSLDENAINRMVDTQVHRGPDDSGTFVSSNCLLGHNRLSIIDLSIAGHQPMASNDGRFVIVFNGEIYNYVEIKKKIGAKYDFTTNTDTEVIIAAYSLWGKDCLEYFNGMFAFAIYDKIQNSLFCVRDRIGIKPFYYYFQKNTLYFASEIKALLAAGVLPVPNDEIIATYLVDGHYDHSEETFFKNILSLKPGCYLEYSKGELGIEQYWSLSSKLDDSDYTSSDYDTGRLVSELNELLADSVKLRLRSDVPFGLHLSGGLDSSLLLAYMDNVIPSGSGRIKAYTGVFGDDKYDEGIQASKIVKKSGVKHSLANFSCSDFWGVFDDAVVDQDQPFGGLATMLNYVLDKLVRGENTIVALEGQGGEELFGGYDYYFYDFLRDVKKFFPNRFDETINQYSRFQNTSPKEVKSRFRHYNEPSGAICTDGTKVESAECICFDFKQRSYSKTSYAKVSSFEFVNSRFRDLQHTKLQRVLRFIDISSMANGVELRVPLLDHRIVEFAFKLPFFSFYKNGESKYLLRELARNFDLLPPTFIDRPKQSVVNPQREWFKSNLAKEIGIILDKSVLYDLGYLDREKTKLAYKKYLMTSNPQNSVAIWQCINLDRWFRKHIL
jgi:asparagine synthase (glutamine-hydrolysing)